MVRWVRVITCQVCALGHYIPVCHSQWCMCSSIALRRTTIPRLFKPVPTHSVSTDTSSYMYIPCIYDPKYCVMWCIRIQLSNLFSISVVEREHTVSPYRAGVCVEIHVVIGSQAHCVHVHVCMVSLWYVRSRSAVWISSVNVSNPRGVADC